MTTVEAHARATFEAEGREEWPEWLVEAVATAIACGLETDGVYVDDYRRSRLAAALSAIGAWEGRE